MQPKDTNTRKKSKSEIIALTGSGRYVLMQCICDVCRLFSLEVVGCFSSRSFSEIMRYSVTEFFYFTITWISFMVCLKRVALKLILTYKFFMKDFASHKFGVQDKNRFRC